MNFKLFFFIFFSNYLTTLPIYGIEDAQLNDSNRCMRYFTYFEKQQDIPLDLLKAVSLTESGIWHKESKNIIPWPWAVNFEGKSYIYKSKTEAVKAVLSFIKQGHRVIDVGCMQINLHHHPKAFKSIEEAFEPKHNIAYAASFLKSHFIRHKNWHKAVAAYHSSNKQFGHPYAFKVIENWRNISRSALFATNKSSKNSMQNHEFSNSNLRKKSSIFIKISSMPKADFDGQLTTNITKKVLEKF